MISGSLAKTNTDTVTGSLSYINDLITGATTSGSYHIVVPRTLMNNAMATQLRSVYGYNVTQKNDFNGVNTEYVISWGNNYDPTAIPTATPTATPTVTPLPATATPTARPTDLPTDTPTPTPSPTPLPATATPTPAPVTSTPTPSPTPTHVDGVDFTIEWWMKATNFTSPTYFPRPYSLGSFPAPNAVSIENVGDHIYWWTGSGSYKIDYSGAALQNNTWYHIAITRDNGTLAIYIDGVRKSTATFNDAIPSAGNSLYIGAEPNGAGAKNFVNGKITNFRWNSSVKYTGTSFTVPTSPLTADSNTKFLMLATDSGNLTTDSSTSPKTITNHGASWSSDSPFVSGGGSVNFAGTGYFTVPPSSDWDL